MLVKAKTYVRIAGRTYAPGDTVEYNLPAVDLDFLVKKGAIEILEPASAPEKEAEPEFVFTPMEEKEEAFSEEDDVLDDIVAPAKKKTARKKG